MALLIVGCTLPNPAFETGDELADDTRGKDTSTNGASESGEAEFGTSAEGSSSMGESASSTSDADTSSSSTSMGEESSSSTTNGESGSTSMGEESSSSTTNGESGSTTSDTGTTEEGSTTLGDTGINECAVVPTGNDCLDCAITNALCCPSDCYDPGSGCGCLILCQLQDTDCGACPAVPLVKQTIANNTVMCLSDACNDFCL